MIKKIINLIAVTIGFLIFIGISILFYSNLTINLENLNQQQGAVDYYDILKNNKNKDVFHLELINSDNEFTFYRMFQKYDDILNNIEENDSVKIYFRENSLSDTYGIEIIQLEKNNEVLISINTYYTKNAIILFLTILASFMMLFFIYIILTNKNIDNFIPRFFI